MLIFSFLAENCVSALLLFPFCLCFLEFPLVFEMAFGFEMDWFYWKGSSAFMRSFLISLYIPAEFFSVRMEALIPGTVRLIFLLLLCFFAIRMRMG